MSDNEKVEIRTVLLNYKIARDKLKLRIQQIRQAVEMGVLNKDAAFVAERNEWGQLAHTIEAKDFKAISLKSHQDKEYWIEFSKAFNRIFSNH